MRCALPIALLLLGGAGCRVVTLIEVETRVEVDGSGTRTIRATSRWQDDRPEPATLPADFLPAAEAYAVSAQAPDRFEASAAFARLDQAPAPFTFAAGARRTGFPAEFRAVDWGFFTLVHYAESVVDAVDAEALRAALEETVTVAAEVAEAACSDFFGAEFDATLLRDRLRGDLRQTAREIAFALWQELYAGTPDVDSLLTRLLPRLRALGLILEPEWFEDWATGEARVRTAVAAWVESQLRPRRAGERTPLPIGLESTLFDGPFAEAFRRAFVARFGSAAAADAWWERTESQLKGSFGSGRDDVSFRLKVRMPGTLLRTDGWIEADGATFLEFPAREAFPRGRGIRCASVVWRNEALAALPVALAPDNSTAISFARVIGDGPDGEPDPALLELLRACVKARGLGPLRDAASDPQQAEAAGAARVLAWLEGARE